MSTFQSINPVNGSLIREYPAIDAAEAVKMLQQSKKAAAGWRSEDYKSRAKVLKALAAQLKQDKEKLAQLATLEMGKSIAQSREEIDKSVRCLLHYAQNGAAILAQEVVETEARRSFITYNPLGVVLAIMPWNFPYWQVFRAAAPILMAGNAMALKHSSNVSGCALAIEQVFRDAGAPKNLFRTLLLPSSEVEQIIADPAVNAVTFTGSTAAGRKVAAAAGAALKKQVLELGGSDAYIILEDADLKKAVKICISGRLVNSGQSCVAAKRFIVVKSLRKEFERLMLEGMQAATYGDPKDESSTIGPMARHDLRDDLHQQVLDSVAKGAKILCGGQVPENPGAFYPPTILTNVKPGMPAYEEELFGPVASIIEAKDEADALRIANSSEYGLGGAIFSKDRKRAEKLAANELDAGSCFVNASVRSHVKLPFGGVKHSGYGRELSSFGIREFTNVKTVWVD